MKALREFRIAEAEADFRKAIRIAPRSGIAGLSYYRLGEIEDRFENRPDRAGEDYIRALENLSDAETRQKASFYLARDLVSQGRLGNAFSVLAKLEESSPDRELLLRATDLSARVLEREEHYRQALDLYRRIREKAEREPVGRHAWLKVGLLEGNLGDHAAAARDLKDFLRDYPHGPSAAIAEFNLARDLSALGHDRQSLALLSDVMGRYPNPDEVNAQIAAVRKKMKQAERHREEATPAPPVPPKK
ncbi:MAG: tetratricopeptide repeat protein [Nitrospirae bacterium]|nr:tetratricopeptide repeat protein [Nitrospirota bacterium]